MNLRISLMLISILLSSCTTVVFQSDHSIPVYMSGQKHHKHKVVISGEKDFYLWGMLPKQHVVSIDSELADIGFLSAANVQIKENVTAMQMFQTIISFGLYTPVTYEISGFGVKAIDE